MYTYQALIRKYSADVESGSADIDLSPQERRLVTVMLNLASNAPRAVVVYPPTDDTRDSAVKHLSDILWDARPLLRAVAPRSDAAIDAAVERTVTILRNI